MKTTGFLLLLGPAAVAAKVPVPDISVGLSFDHDTAGTLNVPSVVPKLSWGSGEMSVGGFDVEGGLDSTMTSFDGIPATNIWGQAKKSLFNNTGAVAVRGEMDTAVPEVVKFNVKVNDFNTNSEVQLVGNNDMRKNNTLGFGKVLGSTGFKAPFGMPGKFALKPSFNIPDKVPDATIAYSHEDTSVIVEAQAQKVSLSQVFGKNKIAPTFSPKSGDLSVGYARSLDNGSVSTTINPIDNDYSVTYSQGSNTVSTTIKPVAQDYTLSFSDGSQKVSTNIKPSDKDFSVAYSRGKLSTSYSPDDALAVGWSDGGLEATVVAPLDGFLPSIGSGVKFGLKKTIDNPLF